MAQNSLHAEHRIFISYAHTDADFAKGLVAELRTRGYECWIDEQAIEGGTRWTRAIAEGIANCAALIVIVTREALQSDWVEKELLWAQQPQVKKPVIPVLLEDVTGEFDAAKGNTDETGIEQTSAVGIFPPGASPAGVQDMSGNVWEWCLSNSDKPALDARKENLRTKKDRVLRGGSWLYDLLVARAVFRNYNAPGDRNNNICFRVVVVRSPSLH